MRPNQGGGKKSKSEIREENSKLIRKRGIKREEKKIGKKKEGKEEKRK